MNKQTVKITLEVPKGVIDFLTDLFKLGGTGETPKEFFEKETVKVVRGILGDLSDAWFDEQKILERYGLAGC